MRQWVLGEVCPACAESLKTPLPCKVRVKAMTVRWTDQQLTAVEKMLRQFEMFRTTHDASRVADEVFDSFGDNLPNDLVSASAQVFEGISKMRALVDFQRMIRR